jgi:P27 family predicted phage terminase small subunit
MGARGPAPRPAALKLLNGTGEGRDSGGRIVEAPPSFVREAPQPPSWLSREARAEWRRVVPSLEALDILKPQDRAALSVYCECWSTFVAAVRQYRAEGMTLTNPDSGRIHTHPAVSIANAAARQFLRYAQEFGLTASAEHRLNSANLAPGDDENNPFSG